MVMKDLKIIYLDNAATTKTDIVLTVTGFASRFIGFFYRIFLSRVFGAEGMGIYLHNLVKGICL